MPAHTRAVAVAAARTVGYGFLAAQFSARGFFSSKSFKPFKLFKLFKSFKLQGYTTSNTMHVYSIVGLRVAARHNHSESEPP